MKSGISLYLPFYMKAIWRFSIQVVLWLMLWSLLTLTRGLYKHFIIINLLTWIAQIGCLATIIFLLAPKLLQQKKFVLYAIYSVLLIFITASLIPKPMGPPNSDKPRMGEPHHRTPHPPPPPHLDPNHIPSPFNVDRPVTREIINVLFISLSIILATAIEIFILAQKREEEKNKILGENLKTELKLLRSQINPHFLFNTLNNIYALSAIDTEKTQKSISYLSDMLRYVIYECEHIEVPIRKEILYIQNYIKLFSLKSSKPYNITFSEDIENEETFIAPMLLIPFIENAFKHSNIEKPINFIDIQLISKKDRIVFQVKNSIPQQKMETDKQGGVGNVNVQKRLSILYPNRHQLIINDAMGIYEVTLELTGHAKA